MRDLVEPAVTDLSLPEVLGALSDPIRLAIVSELARNGEVQCGEFAIDLPKSTLSHHFKVLREAGVTRTRLDGVQRFVRLRRTCMEKRFPGLLETVLSALKVPVRERAATKREQRG